jgi:hypothetical protein
MWLFSARPDQLIRSAIQIKGISAATDEHGFSQMRGMGPRISPMDADFFFISAEFRVIYGRVAAGSERQPYLYLRFICAHLWRNAPGSCSIFHRLSLFLSPVASCSKTRAYPKLMAPR